MLRVTTIAGRTSDPGLSERLHGLEHRGQVETVRLSRNDMARRRQQLRTDRGTVIALMLDRDAVLENGSILLLEDARAVVIALDEPPWLVLRTRDVPHALELGYFAGNMHWKVRFDGTRLCIALEGPRADYLQRLSHLVQSGDIEVEPEAAAGSAHADHSPDAGHAHPHDHSHGHPHGHSHEHSHGHPDSHPHEDHLER
jgi:urease accessory protein